MADIVTRLRDVQPYGLIEDHRVTTDAADEIERLRARCAAADVICLDAGDEIRRLRAAGDQLIAVMRSGTDSGWDTAIDTWEEGRRGVP